MGSSIHTEATGEAPIVVVGAGPAGLTASLELVRAGREVVTLEEDPCYVGGIARTVRFGEYRLDVGGHRFYSKSNEILAWWREVLPDDLIEVRRHSRIYFRGHFFDYPLRAFDVFRKIGPRDSVLSVLSYLFRRMNRIRPEVSFRDWVINRFGDRLFQMFFETYTEKVWGMSCSEISADWAAQRIQGLSLRRAIFGSFATARRGDEVRTLIDRFLYPRLGCGMIWERARELVEETGARVLLDRRVEEIHWRDGEVVELLCRDSAGTLHRYPCSAVISSMPLRDLIRALRPAPPEEILAAAERLTYRDFLTVALVVEREDCFPDQWIYVHDPGVEVGRVQNFGNWSRDMVPVPGHSVLGAEYFCFDGDRLWNAADDKLVAQAREELNRIGLVRSTEVIDGIVVRMPKAYPIYDHHYRQATALIRNWLSSLGNLRSAGRNAMHQYNNQDHSMMAAMIAVGNILGRDQRDPWRVNHEAEYLEERHVPRRLGEAT